MSFEIIIFENQDLYDGTNEIEDEKCQENIKNIK